METLVNELEVQFTSVAPDDYQTLEKLKGEYDALKADLSEMYQSWEALAG